MLYILKLRVTAERVNLSSIATHRYKEESDSNILYNFLEFSKASPVSPAFYTVG